jgi:predicted DNA-binding antitoxin AbrB/MazE fold protein
MVKTIEAVFDGKVFCPASPFTLEPNTRVRITVETVEPTTDQVASFLRTARNLELDGPPDWAVNIDHYLYSGEGQHEG